MTHRSYGKSELAQLYNPHLSISAARRKLMQWIHLQPLLMDALHRSGFSDSMHTFTPYQVMHTASCHERLVRSSWMTVSVDKDWHTDETD